MSSIPDILYHGSMTQGISLLEPRCITKRKQEDGAVIFATPSFSFASCFLFSWDGSWATLVDDRNKLYFIANNEQRLLESDGPGSIYHLNAENFSYDIHTGMGEYEWICTTPQKPVHEQQYDSALQLMRDNNIDFIILSYTDFTSFMNSPYEDRKSALKKYMNK